MGPSVADILCSSTARAFLSFDHDARRSFDALYVENAPASRRNSKVITADVAYTAGTSLLLEKHNRHFVTSKAVVNHDVSTELIDSTHLTSFCGEFAAENFWNVCGSTQCFLWIALS